MVPSLKKVGLYWGFLRDTLKEIRLNNSSISLIVSCVSIVSM